MEESIRNIKKTNVRRRRPATRQREEELSPRQKKRKSKVRFRMFLLLIFVVAIIMLLVTFVFASATVEFDLREEATVADGSYEATKAPIRSGDIVFEVFGPYTAEKSIIVPSVDQKRTSTPASGKVIVKNVAKKQLTLVNRTRFTSPSGNIYRAQAAVTIAAARTGSDGEIIPGEKEISVFADQRGEEFDIAQSGVDFNIPGLATEPQFKGSYATSSTPIIGGFEGILLIPDEDVKAEAIENIQEELKDELIEKARGVISDLVSTPYALFEDAIFVEYEELPQEQVENDIILNQRAKVRAIAFRKSSLAQLIHRNTINDSITGRPSDLTTDSLKFNIIDRDGFDSNKGTSFEFNVTGNTNLRWGVDRVLLLTDIKGKSKSEATSIINSDYKEISMVNDISINPFWLWKLPSNHRKIEIKSGFVDKPLNINNRISDEITELN